MRNRLPTVLLLGVALACASQQKKEESPKAVAEAPRLPAGCPPMPATPLRYTDVEPIFNAHCARCHTASFGVNETAQAAFESTRYPFSTAIPDTLLKGMEDQWRTRRGVDDAERCLALTWLFGGALDQDGNPPPWPR